MLPLHGQDTAAV